MSSKDIEITRPKKKTTARRRKRFKGPCEKNHNDSQSQIGYRGLRRSARDDTETTNILKPTTSLAPAPRDEISRSGCYPRISRAKGAVIPTAVNLRVPAPRDLMSFSRRPSPITLRRKQLIRRAISPGRMEMYSVIRPNTEAADNVQVGAKV